MSQWDYVAEIKGGQFFFDQLKKIFLEKNTKVKEIKAIIIFYTIQTL